MSDKETEQRSRPSMIATGVLCRAHVTSVVAVQEPMSDETAFEPLLIGMAVNRGLLAAISGSYLCSMP